MAKWHVHDPLARRHAMDGARAAFGRPLQPVYNFAEADVLISLDAPTKGMTADAASAGLYERANGRKFPRVQLLTIEGLLDKTQRAEHPDYEPDLNFKKAKQESSGEQKELI